MADWLVQGLTATISGVLTVFLVLILIAMIIGSLQYIINPKKTYELWREKKKATAAKVAKEKNETNALAELNTESTDAQIDDKELVAVITATIAATLGVSSDALVVKSIKRTHSHHGWRRR